MLAGWNNGGTLGINTSNLRSSVGSDVDGGSIRLISSARFLLDRIFEPKYLSVNIMLNICDFWVIVCFALPPLSRS